ncbi:MAG TPA: membrane protein insertion efficiency factor YidD [Acidimicrobiales bacterium]|nr:membrane protein insertion efficiency factor YidD [Acidimicrobiales bacterium]
MVDEPLNGASVLSAPAVRVLDRPAPGGAIRGRRPAADEVSSARGWSRLLVGLIQIYQLARSGRVSPCRFTPTCSQYAVEALSRHGVTRGLRLTAGRLVRCRPGGPFGADPVPE